MERVRPLLKTFSHVTGIQVSMETQNAARSTHHPVRMIRVHGGRFVLAAAIGTGGGSMVARGSRLESRLRNPGRINKAAAMAKNGERGHDCRVPEAVRRDVALQHGRDDTDEDRDASGNGH